MPRRRTWRGRDLDRARLTALRDAITLRQSCVVQHAMWFARGAPIIPCRGLDPGEREQIAREVDPRNEQAGRRSVAKLRRIDGAGPGSSEVAPGAGPRAAYHGFDRRRPWDSILASRSMLRGSAGRARRGTQLQHPPAGR
ncbi:hypothetical protein BJA5080_06916 [Bradyrhizobium diazoefficiens SEMIA 5080]|uniref:Uncharacterized protein n=1 Tax=Bradyrhizobium diazoefficiens SEMIA 5080 TaxID=754504 RepID=A0A837CMA1_9BRAD|nr:hypothetical protein BJA5080_06916 [Bradyrhizobium diazoefficiens SEMIA 5080]